MLSKIKYFLMLGLLIAAVGLSACQNEFDDAVDEGMEFSDEVEDSLDTKEEAGVDFNEEEVAIEEELVLSEEELEEFDDGLCNGFAEYVPCGIFMIEPDPGTMKCSNQTMTLTNTAKEYLTLIPQDDGDQLVAVDLRGAEGTFTLLEVNDEGAIYAGPLVNTEGQLTHYVLYFFADTDFISGSFTTTHTNPGMGGSCTVNRIYTGSKAE